MKARIIFALCLTLRFVSASAQAPHSFCENSSFVLGPETKLAVQEFGLFSEPRNCFVIEYLLVDFALPVSIKPSRVEVKFADGTDYVSTARDWQLESTVGDAKALDFSNFPGSIPGQEFVEIKLPAKGGISSVRIRTPGRPEVNKWFQSELAKWRFSPEVKSGRAVPSQMTLFFRFHRVFDRNDPTPFDETAFRDGSIVPIDIYPKGDVAQNNQFVFVGGIPFVAPD